MNTRSALLIALVAMGYISQPQSPVSSSRTKERTLTAAAGNSSIVYDKELKVEDWPRQTMHEFFANSSAAKKEAEKQVCPLPNGTPVDFLIATVPDPEKSHYPVMFDRFVESIRRASEESGYTLDRFWIPWEADGGPPDGDWLKHEQHQDWLSRKRAYPGVLVFQKLGKDAKMQVLGVLLIGENTITGINKEQFVNALNLMRHFKGPNLGKVRVLGPTFSGSSHSLGIAMKELTRDAGVTVTDYQAITGSATGSHNKHTLETYGCTEQKKPACPSITYEAAIENDQMAIYSFFAYLDPDFLGRNSESSSGRRHEVELEKVAILAESGSGYANQIINSVGGVKARILEYPMEISRLRNAYEDDPELSVLSAGKGRELPRQGVQIHLRDSHGADDIIPTFSPELAPASQEAALSNILATISRERIEYVGIIASDVLDSIFLGHLLKQRCPDVRMFIFDSDLVYGHIAQNYAFQGMMMVTSYPLFTSNQHWTNSWDGSRKTRQFSSAAAEGVYNACIMLLNVQEDPANQTRLAEYAPPVGDARSPPGRPALWLTVVGRGGVWPLTPLDLLQDELKKKGLESSAKEVAQSAAAPSDASLPLLDDPSRGWALSFWLMTLFCGFFAIVVMCHNRARDDGTTIRQGRLAAFRVGSDEHSRTVRIYLTAGAGVLLIAYGFAATTLISHFSLDHNYVARWSSISVKAAFHTYVCVLVMALLLAAALWCWGRAKPAWIAATLITSIAASAIFRAWVYAHPLSLFYVDRLEQLGNGVTPMVPVVLLVLALFWYAYAELNRIRLCRMKPAGIPHFYGDTYLGGVPDPNAKNTHRGGVETVHKKLLTALERSFFGTWREAAWLSVVLLLSLLFVKPLRIGSIETFPFEWYYAAGLSLLYAVLLFGCAKFLRTWADLRHMIGMIERHPIAQAFQAVPKELSPAAAWRWGEGRQSYLTLAYSIERLRKVVEMPEASQLRAAGPFDYKAKLAGLEQNARELMAADSSTRVIERTKIEAVHTTLLEVSNHLVTHVLASYWSRGMSTKLRAAAATATADAGATVTTMTAPATSAGLEENAEEFVALRFVALIRYVTLHLKNLLEFVGGALILAIAGLNSYPFEPHHSITTVISICFFALGAAFVTAFVQMSRNTILSYLSDTTPGKLDGNLFHVLSFGALPLVTVLASQFPSIGGFLFSWVKPTLETLR